jgi:hypothetical protein
MKGFVDEILRKESPKPKTEPTRSVRLMHLREGEPSERQQLKALRALYKTRQKRT